LRVVVDSVVITDRVYPELKEQADRRPTNLTGMYFGHFTTHSIHKFTNLQVYSSLLSTERMVELTSAGSDQCEQSRGDYLAWEDMKWSLTGGAELETVFRDEPCAPARSLQLYPPVTPLLGDAVHHCKKVGGRITPVSSEEDFKAFEEQVTSIAFDRLRSEAFFSLYSFGIWIPITDQETEGEWRDVYTGEEGPLARFNISLCQARFRLLEWVGSLWTGSRTEDPMKTLPSISLELARRTGEGRTDGPVSPARPPPGLSSGCAASARTPSWTGSTHR
jgi:hypothetical protein